MCSDSSDTCRHCDRTIVYENGAWIDPEATGNDAVWRETCDSHDTFMAEHEPIAPGGSIVKCANCGQPITDNDDDLWIHNGSKSNNCDPENPEGATATPGGTDA